MLREDVILEVRNRQLLRVGTITPKFLKLTATVRHNDVGEWFITLPGNHPMIEHLSAHGSGIIVYVRGAVEFSGPTVLPAKTTDSQNPDGTYTFEGVTDNIHLADALAYPSPAMPNPGLQTAANDYRTGSCSLLMRQYVQYNIVPGSAPSGRVAGLRNFLQLETGHIARGPDIVKAPRFQNLLELLREIAALGNLGFQVIQRGSFLVFEVLDVRDRTGTVRFDIHNGTLTSEKVEVSAPNVTRTVVAGQGEGVKRTIIARTNAASVTAETDWGRVIERFVDARNTNVVAELQQSGDEVLLEGGFTATNIKVLPSDNTTMEYAIEWRMGDRVAVVVDGQETASTVTAASFIVDDTACIVGAAIGEVTGFDANSALTKRVDDVARRTDALERTIELNTEKTDAAGEWAMIQLNPNVAATVNITFPPNRFTMPPIVLLTPGSSRVGANVSAVTVNGCTITYRNVADVLSGATVGQWYAVQMTRASAAG